MSLTIPETFGTAFLEWLRDATERTWSTSRPRTLEQWVAGGVGGAEWAQGTRWTGMTEAEIDQLELAEGIRFSADYRLFLRHMHSTAPRRTGAVFVDSATMEPATRPGFYDWRTDADLIRQARESVVGGLVFDVETSDLWLPEWGTKPRSADDRASIVNEAVRSAPRLLPIFGHRFLLAEPCAIGNPVFSIHQSDIIVYGANLHAYLLAELGSLLGLPEQQPATSGRDYSVIPFWGRFLT